MATKSASSTKVSPLADRVVPLRRFDRHVVVHGVRREPPEQLVRILALPRRTELPDHLFWTRNGCHVRNLFVSVEERGV